MGEGHFDYLGYALYKLTTYMTFISHVMRNALCLLICDHDHLFMQSVDAFDKSMDHMPLSQPLITQKKDRSR